MDSCIAEKVMLPFSFDDREIEDLSIEEIVSGPPEYSQWNERNYLR